MFNKIIGEAKGIFNIVTIIEIIIAIICILLGLTFFTSSSNYVVVGIVTGLIMIVTGGYSIYSYLKKANVLLYNYNLIFGIIYIILGLVTFFISLYSSIMLGIFLILEAGRKISYGIVLKKYNESSWLLTVVCGILFLVIGVIALFASRDNLVAVIGTMMFGYGAINLLNTVLLRKRSNYFLA